MFLYPARAPCRDPHARYHAVYSLGKLAMIVREGGRRTICCDQLMEKMATQENEDEKEAHIPVIERTATGIVVSAPGVSDPIDENHYIEWIEMTEGPYTHLKELRPGDAPVAEFCIGDPKPLVRLYCDTHGIWSNNRRNEG